MINEKPSNMLGWLGLQYWWLKRRRKWLSEQLLSQDTWKRQALDVFRVIALRRFLENLRDHLRSLHLKKSSPIVFYYE